MEASGHIVGNFDNFQPTYYDLLREIGLLHSKYLSEVQLPDVSARPGATLGTQEVTRSIEAFRSNSKS